MKPRAYILSFDSVGWSLATWAEGEPRFATLPVDPDDELDTQLDAVVEALQQHDYAGEPLMLALGSSLCLWAHVDTHGLPSKQRRQALVYRMEEKLPVAAEDVAADFMEFGEDAVAVCAAVGPLKPLVDGLEHRHVTVQSICPATLLAAQAFDAPRREAHAQALLIAPASQLELLVFEGERLVGWHQAPRDKPGQILFHVRFYASQRPEPMRVLAEATLVDAVTTAAEGELPAEITTSDKSSEQAAIATAGQVLSGQSPPWIDLRRDALAIEDPLRQVRRPLKFAAAAAILLLVLLNAAMMWRTHEHQQLESQALAVQQQAFERVFPGQPPPPSVKANLEAVWRGAQAASGQGQLTSVNRPSALQRFHSVLASLPEDVRVRILKVKVDPTELRLKCQVRQASDVDVVVDAISRAIPEFRLDYSQAEYVAAGAAAPGAHREVVQFEINGSARRGSSLRASRR